MTKPTLHQKYNWFHNNCAEVISLHKLSRRKTLLVIKLYGRRFYIKGNSASDVLDKALVAVDNINQAQYAKC